MSQTDRDQVNNLDCMEWDELVGYKRQLLNNLREASDKITDLEINGIHRMRDNIQHEKNIVLDISKKTEKVRLEMTKFNSQLLNLSENIVKAKDFVVTMQPRLPSESEADLYRVLEANQRLITNKHYKNERNRNEAISQMNCASMKLEAIKAVRAVNDQLEDLSMQAKLIEQKINILDMEKRLLQAAYDNGQQKLDILFNDKRILSDEHQTWLMKYEKYIANLDGINYSLDKFSKKRRANHYYRYRSDASTILRVKESAKKKFEAGDKLSIDELRLLYADD